MSAKIGCFHYNTWDLRAHFITNKSVTLVYCITFVQPNPEILDVGYNKIGEVQPQVAPLKNLITLDYSHNLVKGDLDFLLRLPQIKEIYLRENQYAANEEEEKHLSRVVSVLAGKGVVLK